MSLHLPTDTIDYIISKIDWKDRFITQLKEKRNNAKSVVGTIDTFFMDFKYSYNFFIMKSMLELLDRYEKITLEFNERTVYCYFLEMFDKEAVFFMTDYLEGFKLFDRKMMINRDTLHNITFKIPISDITNIISFDFNWGTYKYFYKLCIHKSYIVNKEDYEDDQVYFEMEIDWDLISSYESSNDTDEFSDNDD